MSWFKPQYSRHPRESRDLCTSGREIPAFAGMTVIAGMTAVVAMLLLSSCGFAPMYGTHSAAAEAVDTALPNIDIGNIPDRDGQYLRNLLIDRLYTHGRPDDAPYIVNFSRLTEALSNLGIDKEATATRAQIQIMTHMDLVDKSTGKAVLQRDLKVVGAYNLLDDQLSTLMSKQNVTDSILQEMRDDAVTEISLYFRRKAMGEKTVNPPPAPPAAPK